MHFAHRDASASVHVPICHFLVLRTTQPVPVLPGAAAALDEWCASRASAESAAWVCTGKSWADLR